jgi:hypothetical protein
MPLNESDKAVVRSFLSTTAAKNWLEYCDNNYPALELSKSTRDMYEISMYEEKGWKKRGLFQISCVQESLVPEYGQQAIDPVPD